MVRKKLFEKSIKLKRKELLFFLVIVLYLFPNFVYSQILYVPFLSQRDVRWSSDTLGSCTGCTIGSDGCATTSKAMVFNYFCPNYTDPGLLNTCLLNNGGYEYNSQNCVGYCLIPWDDKNNICAPPGVTFAGHFTDNLYSRIDSELLKGYPVIAKIRCGNIMHFVVITGKYGSTYYINDPYDISYQCRTLNNGYFGNYEIDAIWLFRGPVQIPLSGDWDGDGVDTFGYFENNVFYLDNEQTLSFGIPGDYPIIGDWDGDGSDDIGIFRAKEEGVDQSTFYLELLNDGELGGLADYLIAFGYYPDDIPLVGDWDGDGDDDIGGYYTLNSTFYLYKIDLNTSTAISYKDISLGQSCDIPITGDWDCDGDDDLGVFRTKDPNENTNNFYFDIDLTGGQAEYNVISFGSNGYGNIGDMPVIGDWDGDGDDNIGVYRPSDPGSTLDKFYTNSSIPDTNVCNNPPNTPSTPSGPSSGYVGTSCDFSTSTTDPDGDTVYYRFDWGDGYISSWGDSTQSHSWNSTGNYTVKAQAKDSHGAASSWSDGKTINISEQHSVTTPNTPSGPSSGEVDTSYAYTTGGSSCSLGHSVEYRIDWGDGTYSDWSSSTSASHSWSTENTYSVKTQARCSVDHNIVSDWSLEKSVTISQGITQYNLNISTTAGGTTNPSPGTYTYNSGTQVEVNAAPDDNYNFHHWTGDVPEGHETDNPLTLTMDADRSVTANFLLITQYTLTIAASSGGTTEPAPETYIHDEGTEVYITAMPNTNYKFSGWTGDVQGGDENDNPLTITMDSNKSVTANFIRQYTLTIDAGSGGTTNPSPGSYEYDSEASVIVTAMPDSNHEFSGWSGDASGTDNPITITMDSDKSVTANFEAIPPPPKPPDEDGKKGGCFIATAAYGSPLHSCVKILRDFRDKYLMPTKPGRMLVDFYYKNSPFFADLIAKHKVLKIMTRFSLLPVIVFSYSMLHFGPIITLVMTMVIFVFPIFLISFFRRKLRRWKPKSPKALASLDWKREQRR